MKIFGATDTGLVRSSNQDSFLTGRFDSGTVWAVVCDGMGGALGGDVASKMAAELIAERIVGNYNDKMKPMSVSNLFESAINFANIKIYDRALADDSLKGMGTTVVAAILRDGEALISHSGDSRAYIVGKGVRQVTTDHSIVQEMLDRGEITQDEAKHHPIKNFITRALGVKDRISVDFTTEKFEDNDVLLICTDGLSNMVDDLQIKEIATDANEDNVKELINLANKNGGRDNITVVIASY